MSWDFDGIQNEVIKEIGTVSNFKALEAIRIKYLGRKGLIAQIYSSLPTLSADERPIVGKRANELKNKIAQLLEEKQRQLDKTQSGTSARDALDITIPGVASPPGHRHILTQTISDICCIFEKIGFIVMEGPEIETEFNNFTALNIPVDHPSRDAFDTFYLKGEQRTENREQKRLLRSHTSPAQIRIMEEYKPPLAVVVPGRVYRPDAVDASHSFMFHQVEGLLVDEKVSFCDLKVILSIFCRRFFGDDIKMRFRPHFFPFTEPSAEVDISCYICKGKGCSVCARKGWLEIMGCGMVHPKVFEAVGYPQDKYTGLAFGMGVERIAMLKYGIDDIRIFFENDLRFLMQF